MRRRTANGTMPHSPGRERYGCGCPGDPLRRRQGKMRCRQHRRVAVLCIFFAPGEQFARLSCKTERGKRGNVFPVFFEVCSQGLQGYLHFRKAFYGCRQHFCRGGLEKVFIKIALCMAAADIKPCLALAEGQGVRSGRHFGRRQRFRQKISCFPKGNKGFQNIRTVRMFFSQAAYQHSRCFHVCPVVYAVRPTFYRLRPRAWPPAAGMQLRQFSPGRTCDILRDHPSQHISRALHRHLWPLPWARSF